MIDEMFNYTTSHKLHYLLGQSAKLQKSTQCRVRISGSVVTATELPDNLNVLWLFRPINAHQTLDIIEQEIALIGSAEGRGRQNFPCVAV